MKFCCYPFEQKINEMLKESNRPAITAINISNLSMWQSASLHYLNNLKAAVNPNISQIYRKLL